MPPDNKNMPPAPAPHRAGTDQPPCIDSETLFRGGDELLIRHRGRNYRLRITQNDKLILNA